MIYDISPPITEALWAWPGDVPFERTVSSDITKGDGFTLSSLRATAHLGAHADAPSHFAGAAQGIGERDLDYYLGPCQVLRVAPQPNLLITPRHTPGEIIAPRVLFATGTFPDPTHFNEDFAAVSPQLVDTLSEKGVKLIGIDTPGVDPFTSNDCPAHKRCLAHDIAILEGLVLADVPAGLYELIALPLKLIGCDASPVRAILKTIAG
ncbi:MAG: cyclase family protein [Phycisphaerales bacterium]|nr:MAG: cyclase family protein [Phycisphaerales bacterium]